MTPRAPLLVDTSFAVALVVADHARHRVTAKAVKGKRLGLAGHAWFETYSVLTRLPAPHRRAPAAVATLLEHEFPATRYLSPEAAAAAAASVSSLGIGGGAVYDALVAAAAVEHGSKLLSRDRRAADVYGLIGADFELH